MFPRNCLQYYLIGTILWLSLLGLLSCHPQRVTRDQVPRKPQTLSEKRKMKGKNDNVPNKIMVSKSNGYTGWLAGRLSVAR